MSDQPDSYSLDELFVRESDDGELDFLFADPPAPPTIPEPVLTRSFADLKAPAPSQPVLAQCAAEALYVVVGDDGDVLTAPSLPDVKDSKPHSHSSWASTLASLVFGIIGLYARSRFRKTDQE